MNLRKTARPLLLLIALGTLMAARFAHAADATQVWEMVAGTASLHPGEETGPRLWLDLHARHGGPGLLGIVRPGVGYDFGAGLSAWVGYSYVPVRADDGAVTTGQDVWAQGLAAGAIGDLGWMARPRFELRFAEGQDDSAVRFRLFGRLGYRLLDRLHAVVWDEYFHTVAEAAWAPAGFGENRVFVGPGFPLDDGWRVEGGYLNRLRGTGDDRATDHVIMLSVFWSA